MNENFNSEEIKNMCTLKKINNNIYLIDVRKNNSLIDFVY